MSKKLTQKELWQQFFKHCPKARNESGIRFSLVGDALMASGEIVADLSTEEVEMGLLRVIKRSIEERTAVYNQKKEDLLHEGEVLRLELMRVSDALASQGTSVDKDYGSDPKDMKGS